MLDLYETIKNYIGNHSYLDVFYQFFPGAPNMKPITKISETPYEKNLCKNKTLVFIPNQNISENQQIDNLKLILSLDQKMTHIEYPEGDETCDNYRENITAIRKFINPINDGYCAVFIRTQYKKADVVKDGYVVAGISTLENLKNIFYYKVVIQGIFEWNLSIHTPDKKDFGLFNHTSKGIQKFLAYEKSTESPDKTGNSRTDAIINMVHSLTKKLECGTALIIFENPTDAKNEADRLCNAERGYRAEKPFSVKKEENLLQILNVDGGFIIDQTGQCYAHGCTFDGTVPKSADRDGKQYKGVPGHGARHNSIKLYVENKNFGNQPSESSLPCMGIVFSEDGMITVYQRNNENQIEDISIYPNNRPNE